MTLSTERIIEKYNFWTSKLETATDRTDKKNAREMRAMFFTMLGQRNINL